MAEETKVPTLDQALLLLQVIEERLDGIDAWIQDHVETFETYRHKVNSRLAVVERQVRDVL